MNSYVGVDVGGTKISVATYASHDFSELSHAKIDTEAVQGFESVYERLCTIIEKSLDSSVQGIGLGVPGLVHSPAGKIHTLPNIPGADSFELQKALQEKFSLPVVVDNDANCFALAEAMYGAGKGEPVVVGITMGTGVGGGIVIHQKLLQGAHGFSAEIGHMLLQPGKPPFETEDLRGEVEQFFSGTAMGKRCAAAKDPTDYLDGEVCSFMHKDIYREVSWMLCNIIHLLDPSIIVFGGSAGHAISQHFDDVKAELKNWLLPNTPIPRLALETLKDSSTLGAALLCTQK